MKFSVEELKTIVERHERKRKNKLNFKVGDMIEFSDYYGSVLTCIVLKIQERHKDSNGYQRRGSVDVYFPFKCTFENLDLGNVISKFIRVL